MNPFSKAFGLSLPVLFTYIPLGLVFGLLFEQAGYGWYWAPLFSLFVFAGAIQFVAIMLIAAGSSMLGIVIAVLPLALRNIFYGLSFLDRYRFNFFTRIYMAFGLVDSTYSILVTNDQLFEGQEDKKFCISLTVLHHFYWVFGTFVGALVGSKITVPAGLEFALTALFVVMAIEQLEKSKSLKPILIAGVGLLVAAMITPSYLLAGGLFISAILCMIFPLKDKAVVA